jgi:predicted ATPase
VGRQDALDRLGRLQREHARHRQRAPVAAIVGAPGVGKTALALRWAHLAAPAYPDGQLYIDLKGAANTPAVQPSEALPFFLRSLGVPYAEIPAGVAAQTGLFRSLTYARRLLIVLDNASNAEQVRQLLPGGPACFTLITSRNRLSGLVAREAGLRLTLSPLQPEEAERLVTLMLGDGWPVREPDALRELTRLCGYLPLALRIAAANLADRPFWSISEYVARLAHGNRLAELAVADDDSTAVQAAFDVSYAALDDPTQRLFRSLAAAPAPSFSTHEAAALAKQPPSTSRPLLDALVAAHLIEQTGPDRYTLYDLVRLYAEKLAQDQTSATSIAA